MVRAVVVLLLFARVAHAQCAHDKTLPIARGPVHVDGVLDDATWATACFAEDFEQQSPHFGKPPTHPVKVAVAIDGATLYVGARMWSAGPDDIDDALTQRDDTDQAERFIVSIDPSHTRRIAYSFAVTAQGVRADWIHTDDSQGSRDASWNPVWVAKARILPDGWSAEMAIPLSQLRLPSEPATSWGIDFDWFIPHRSEDVFWRAVPPDRTAWASMFGELVALPPIHPGVALELLPYAATKLILDEAPSGALAHRWRAGFEAGLDAKLRPLPGLTIAATINPDFGQVDADPAFVNLSAYEVQLPEKRPFFVENNSLFANGDPDAFYSRRIGGLPHLLPAADAIDLPAQVRILGAVAAGGYIAPRTQVAALAAVTDETSADAIIGSAAGAGRKTSLVVSPLTGWAAARIEQQFGPSIIAGTGTLVERALGGTGLEGLLSQTAYYLESDAKLRTDDGTYELSPFVGVTGVLGTAAAMLTLQTDETHYYQRPDQPHVHVDPTAHSMYGWLGGANGGKRAGLYRGQAGFFIESPGWELNDMGHYPSADNIVAFAGITRNVTTPTKHVYQWDTGLNTGEGWNFGGVRAPPYVKVLGDVTFTSFHIANVYYQAQLPGDSDDLTRGGPRMHLGWGHELGLHAATPYGRATQLGANLTVDLSSTLLQGVTAAATLGLRVVPSVRLDVAPTLTLVETHRQYVATVTDSGGGADTYGARYLFGQLGRKEASLILRATWSLSPDLVMTLYAQPFVSVGRYEALGELVSPASGDVRWYDSTAHVGATRAIMDAATAFTIAEPDYSVAALRSTAVLRWEPAPGSTLFVVWQQQRGGSSSVAQPLHGVVPDVFTQSAIHTFAVKLSWWFG